MSAPLEWVKLYTRLDMDGDWRQTPVTHRYVFLHLIILGGLSSARGRVQMDDGAIAAHLGVEKRDVTAAVDRFAAAPWRSLSRSAGAVVIKNWPKFQGSDDREETRGEKKRTLRSLPEDREWWDALAKLFPRVDLATEHQKALEWHGAPKVKSPKLFFRNWVEREAKKVRADVLELPDLDREEGRIG